MPSKRGGRAGRRVQRGHEAAQSQQAPSLRDACLDVESALTDQARLRIMQWWDLANPARAGAPVADLLDLLTDSDSYLNATERFWDLRGEQLSGELGDRYGVIGPSATAAVILLGLTNVAASGGHLTYQASPEALTLLDQDPPSDYLDLTVRLARAAAAGRRQVIDAPDPGALAAWVSAEGMLLVRHPREEALALAATGECDSCVHPRCDHDQQTGACLRISPTHGPCPCAHTSQPDAEVQRELLEHFQARAVS